MTIVSSLLEISLPLFPEKSKKATVLYLVTSVAPAGIIFEAFIFVAQPDNTTIENKIKMQFCNMCRMA